MVNLAKFFVLAFFYANPSERAWRELHDSIENHPRLSFKVVINPAEGPGSSDYPDEAYIQGFAKLNTYKNAQTFGYVSAKNGTRPLEEIRADINRYRDWDTYGIRDIRVRGVYVDEAPSDHLTSIQYMIRIFAHAKQVLPDVPGNTVMTNPGVPVHRSFYNYADYINAFQDSYENWEDWGLNSIPIPRISTSTIMMSNYTPGDAQMVLDIKTLKKVGYAGILINPKGNYTALDSNWYEFMDNASNATEFLVINPVD